jgi:hypothetical protein
MWTLRLATCRAPRSGRVRGLAAGPARPHADARRSRGLLLLRMQGVHLARPRAKALRPRPRQPASPRSSPNRGGA